MAKVYLRGIELYKVIEYINWEEPYLPSIFRFSSLTHSLIDIHFIMHYCDFIMDSMACQISSLTFVCSNVYSDADQRKHQSSASLAFVWGIHRGPVNSPHKGPVTRKMFPFDDVIMSTLPLWCRIFLHKHVKSPSEYRHHHVLVAEGPAITPHCMCTRSF